MSDDAKWYEFTKAMVALFISLGNGVFSAFVMTRLWTWFVVSKFGLPTLTIAQAYGLLLVIGFTFSHLHMSVNKIKADTNEDESKGTAALISAFSQIAANLVFWGFGYVAQQFL